MKVLKYIPAIIVMLSVGLTANGQNGGVTPAFHWRCSSGDVLINHNSALRTTGGAIVFDSLPYARNYTVIVVYKPVADTESLVWQLSFGDSASRGLTTERILSDSIAIRYAEHTDGSPAINTLRQTAPEASWSGIPSNGTSDSMQAYVRLTIGDGLDVAEVLYYTERLGNTALRKVQSCLAVRYGITLGPVDYLDGTGRHVWNHTDNGVYRHRITGVGIDTVTGLHQLHSRSEMDGAVLTVSTDSIGEGGYLIVGDDDNPLTYNPEQGSGMPARKWRVQGTGTAGSQFSLVFNTGDMPVTGDSLVLMVYGVDSLLKAMYSPAMSGADSVVFRDVSFSVYPEGTPDSVTGARDEDVVFLTLGHSSLLRQRSLTHGGSDVDCTDPGSRFTARVYPNPTNGRYTLEVDGAGQVNVTIHNTLGRVVAAHSGHGCSRHRFEGSLPSGNAYYVTVVTENGSQTMKLTVK